MYIIIAGNIGVGKSSLTSRIAEAFGWLPLYETADENPYLADFYSDMNRWAFHSQTYFLAQRIRMQSEILSQSGPIVQDRSLYEDAEIFAANLYHQGAIDSRDYATYRALYESVCTLLPTPDLLVYLRADVPTLQRRIALRGRSFERAIAPDYLMRLNALYDSWIERWQHSPVLTVPADRLDFVRNPIDLEAILNDIRSALRLPVDQFIR